MANDRGVILCEAKGGDTKNRTANVSYSTGGPDVEYDFKICDNAIGDYV